VDGGTETVVAHASRRRLADEWSLVLAAEGLTPALRQTSRGFALCVPAEQAERAGAALAGYLAEPARPALPSRVGWTGPGPALSGLILFGSILASFIVTGPARPGSAWAARGAADAGRILAGEPWRVLTALSLHADAGHAFANAVAGGLFCALVFQAFGPGFGLLLVVCAGGLGNLANAVLHGPGHVSVGASTAVFGAAGVLAGAAIRSRRARFAGRPWLPIAASLALLALLGTSGERTDLWAHAFGLAVGLCLGTAAGWRDGRPPGVVPQWICAGLALALLTGAWALALGPWPRAGS
jgi:membrane associated rhomboid family serine protease